MRAINCRRSLVGVLLLGIALSAAAHREPGSLTTIKSNASSGKTEIVHRLHSHDAELGIGQVLGIADLSVLDLEGRAFIALYVEGRFRIAAGEEDIQLDLIGAELAGDYVLVYQEHSAELPAQIRVHDSILRDVYPAQINQVNIEDGDTAHSLVFTADDDWLSYEFTQVQTTQPMTQAKPMVEPNGVANDFRRESVTFVGDHLRIIRRSLLTCQHPPEHLN